MDEKPRLPSQVRAQLGSKEIDAQTKDRVQLALEKLPLYFIENRGQLNGEVAYYIQGRNVAIYFSSEDITFSFTRSKKVSDVTKSRNFGPSVAHANPRDENQSERWTVKLDFVGANAGTKPRGEDRTPRS